MGTYSIFKNIFIETLYLRLVNCVAQDICKFLIWLIFHQVKQSQFIAFRTYTFLPQQWAKTSTGYSHSALTQPAASMDGCQWTGNWRLLSSRILNHVVCSKIHVPPKHSTHLSVAWHKHLHEKEHRRSMLWLHLTYWPTERSNRTG